MGTLAAQSVVDRVKTILQDADSVRWPVAELLLWISDAQREIASYKPDAFVKTTDMALVAGSRQTLPADAVLLIDIVRNTVGSLRATRVVPREMMDAQLPGWHTTTQAQEVKHVIFDAANQKTFYVYPPNTGTGSLEVVYSAAPDEVSAGGNLLLDDSWLPIVTNYVLYRAYSKDAEHAANAQLAIAYYQAFTGQMTGRSNAEAVLDPNRNAPIINPNVRQMANPNPPLGG